MAEQARMTDAVYLQTQQQLLLLGHVALQLDLEGFLQRINEAETLVPLTDPTLYLKGANNLSVIKRLARAAFKFQREVKAIRARAEERATKKGAGPDG